MDLMLEECAEVSAIEDVKVTPIVQTPVNDAEAQEDPVKDVRIKIEVSPSPPPNNERIVSLSEAELHEQKQIVKITDIRITVDNAPEKNADTDKTTLSSKKKCQLGKVTIVGEIVARDALSSSLEQELEEAVETGIQGQAKVRKNHRFNSGSKTGSSRVRLPVKRRALNDRPLTSENESPLVPRKCGRRSSLATISVHKAISEMKECLHRQKIAPYVGRNGDFSWLFPGYDDYSKLVKSFMKAGSSGSMKKAANGSFSQLDEMLMMILVLWHDSISSSVTLTFWREMMVKGYLLHHTESSLVGRWKRSMLPYLDRFPKMPNPVKRALEKLSNRRE